MNMTAQNQVNNEAPIDPLTLEEATSNLLPSQVITEQLAALGEELGKFKAYDSQLPIAEIEGTRIVKCLYQVNSKTGKKVAENAYCRIPVKHLTEEVIVERIAELTPYVLGFLQAEEDKIVKERHKSGGLNVYPESMSIDQIIELLEASETGARLNKEKIEKWFIDCMQDSLAELFAVKMGVNENSSEEQLNKLELVLNAYKGKFASLASGKTFITQADCNAMISCIERAELQNSLLGSRFIKRLQGMQVKNEELLMAL